MKVHSIRFDDEMVLAILSSDKTQTRWPLDPQPIGDTVDKSHDGLYVDGAGNVLTCKYGSVGDLLSVKGYPDCVLEITELRIERLQDISERDAWAEGCLGWDDDVTGGSSGYGEFYSLWIETYGKDSWEENPFVWVMEFKK